MLWFQICIKCIVDGQYPFEISIKHRMCLFGENRVTRVSSVLMPFPLETLTVWFLSSPLATACASILCVVHTLLPGVRSCDLHLCLIAESTAAHRISLWNWFLLAIRICQAQAVASQRIHDEQLLLGKTGSKTPRGEVPDGTQRRRTQLCRQHQLSHISDQLRQRRSWMLRLGDPG